MHLIGVIAHQSGRNDVAVVRIKKAICLNPDNPLYYNNLGAALRETGQQNEALVNYKKALQLKPDYAEAAYNMASVFLVSGQLSDAIFWYQKAVQIKPDYVDAWQWTPSLLRRMVKTARHMVATLALPVDNWGLTI